MTEMPEVTGTKKDNAACGLASQSKDGWAANSLETNRRGFKWEKTKLVQVETGLTS
jgi:hypothetical protein